MCNPNVTHAVTQEVLLLSRWQAAELYWRDIDALRAVVGDNCREPSYKTYQNLPIVQ